MTTTRKPGEMLATAEEIREVIGPFEKEAVSYTHLTLPTN